MPSFKNLLTPTGRAATIALVVSLLPALMGCSSFGHWKDPTLEQLTDAFCLRKAQAHEAEFKKEAEARGIPLAEILAAFQAACLLRMQQSAERAGMAGVHARFAKAPAK